MLGDSQLVVGHWFVTVADGCCLIVDGWLLVDA